MLSAWNRSDFARPKILALSGIIISLGMVTLVSACSSRNQVAPGGVDLSLISSVPTQTASSPQSDGSNTNVGSSNPQTPAQVQLKTVVVDPFNGAPNYVLSSSDLQSLSSAGLLSADEQSTLNPLVAN